MPIEVSWQLLALVAFSISAFLLGCIFRCAGLDEFLLFAFIAFCSLIILTGYALSTLDLLGSIPSWGIAGTAIAACTSLAASRVLRRNPYSFAAQTRSTACAARKWLAMLPRREKILVFPPVVSLAILFAANMVLVCLVAPHNWDGLTYHLARMAYYLQQGNFDYFDANYWAQVVHPKNSTVLLTFAYLVSGRNENLTQMVQLICHGASIVSVFAISRRAGMGLTGSLVSASVFGLLVENLMQAVTVQNDMVWSAFLGTCVYALVAYRVQQQRKYLVLASICIALAIGVKAASLAAIPSVLVVTLYGMKELPWTRRGAVSWTTLAVSGILASALFILPSGYLGTLQRFGSPLGPERVQREHSFVGKAMAEIPPDAAKNLARYALDFVSLDGLPPTGAFATLQTMARSLPVGFVRLMHWELEGGDGIRTSFSLDKTPSAHEDFSSWGVMGFGLVWIAVFVSFFSRNTPAAIKILALAAVVFVVAQSFAGPYDHWRGRYFIFGAIVATPAVGLITFHMHRRAIWGSVLSIVFLGCLSAMSAVFLRPMRGEGGFVFRHQDLFSLVRRDRLDQLTTNFGKMAEPIRRFDASVPPDAAVAVCLPENSFEYPLFGEHLSRTLFPVNSFERGIQALPNGAEYLLFTHELAPPLPTDQLLGERWYLRQLRRR